MSKILKELEDATGLEQKRREDDEKFRTRIARSAAELADDDWAKLSEKAQGWVNDCIDALNDESDLPELPDAKGNGKKAKDEEPEEDEKPARRRGSKKDEEEPEEEKPSRRRGKKDEEAEEEKPARRRGSKKDEEAEEEEKPARRRAAGKKDEDEKPSKKVSAKGEGKSNSKAPRDKFGLLKSSKASEAAAMFASRKGAKMKDVKDATGTTHYNLLTRLEADGHTIEKEGGSIKLIHKDD